MAKSPNGSKRQISPATSATFLRNVTLRAFLFKELEGLCGLQQVGVRISIWVSGQTQLESQVSERWEL